MINLIIWLVDKMSFSYYYIITIMLLVTVIPVYGIVLTANTTTISRTSYVASAFSNESAITQRPDNPQVNASRTTAPQPSGLLLQEFSVPTGSHPHDVAPAANGIVWYTAQGSGELGQLDTSTNQTHRIALDQGSAPHGVIVGPDGAPWITDGGLNAIVRVDPETEEVKAFPLPEDTGYANLNTATFDKNGTLWFTGQSGIYGRLDPLLDK
jgi:streptogramin lyase